MSLDVESHHYKAGSDDGQFDVLAAISVSDVCSQLSFGVSADSDKHGASHNQASSELSDVEPQNTAV